MKQIETEIWVPNPEKPGYLMLERVKTYNEVFEEMVQELKEERVYDELDYFSNVSRDKRNETFPSRYQCIACFAVRGGSEGHYIHIDVISESGRETIFLGKTFLGLEHALKVSNICTQLFYK
jgi:hypothetical protein